MSRLKLYIFTALTSVALNSCAVGPNFQPPAPPQTDAYTAKPLPSHTVSAPGEGGKSQRLVFGEDIPAQWWELFHSPALDALIRQGLANSPNLAAAEAALREAQQNLRAQIGTAYFPSVNGVVSDSRQKASGASFGSPASGAFNSIFNLYNASVQVGYTFDVFGGSRRETEALLALVDYQRFQWEAAYLALTTNIVTTAIAEASYREQIRATKELLTLESDQLDIIQKQFELGGASRADVLTQQTLVAQTDATLPPLEKQLSQARHHLAVLVGELPSESKLPTFHLDKLQLPVNLPLSIPSALVRQRPDIRASEALLHQASAQIGVATANLFPQLTLTGNYGSQTDTFSDWFKANTAIWSIGMQALQPIFQGGSLIAQRRAAIAAYEQALAQYAQVVLVAFGEVADTLRAVEIDARALQAQSEAEASAKETLFLTQSQFRLGAVNYLFLLNAERQYQETRISRIQAEAMRYADTAALFQALGGGWWNRDE